MGSRQLFWLQPFMRLLRVSGHCSGVVWAFSTRVPMTLLSSNVSFILF